MGNFVLAVGRDRSDFMGMLANQPAVFRGSARAVGGCDAGSSLADPSGLGHRAEFDGPAPAPAGVGHGVDFGGDRGRARAQERPYERQAVAVGGRAAGGGICRARHHGGVRRVVLLVPAVEAGGADDDGADAAEYKPAAHGARGGAAMAPGMDFRSDLGCVAAGGGHALLLFCIALALVRVAGGGSAAALAVVVPGAGRAPQPDGSGSCGGAAGLLWRVPVGGGANNPAARPAGAFASPRADALSASCVLVVCVAGGGIAWAVRAKETCTALASAVCAAERRDVLCAAADVSGNRASGTAGPSVA